MVSWRCSSAFLCLMATPVVAQTTWNVVPPAANLFQAVAAANHGDTINVASGYYDVQQGLVINKGVTVVGQPQTTIVGHGGGPALSVENIPAGRRFIMQGVDVTLSGYALGAAFAFVNCSGDIHVSKCRFLHTYLAQSVARDLFVYGCSNVTWADCETQNITVLALSSSMQMSRCVLRGHAARSRYPYSGGRAPTEGLFSYGVPPSRVTLAQCSVFGGAGDIEIGGAPAISVLAGNILSIAGDGSDTIAAGAPGALATQFHSAIWNRGTLSLAPQISLVPNAGRPPIDGGFQTSPRPISVAAQTAPHGGTATATVLTDPGESTTLILGLPSPPWSLPSLGTVWLQPNTLVVLGSTVIGGNARWTVPIPIPPLPALRSVPIGLQAVGGSATAPIRLSVPCTFVIE